MPQRQSHEWFFKGPIPGNWLQRAAPLPGRALHVGLAVWHATALERSNQARLTGKLLSRFGVQSDAGRRALWTLEQNGLVTVVRHPGRCPIVSIVTTRELNA